ncbi:hypothetical protein H6P81_014176 [Aristolochia fimbriata]|uniref:Uncharacterized protein n=1 Tax=Aristolochia fimbriata TaxID=158543 RepID=A0AAV7EH03_ARIFI|nr:hypothetical protein H6P81_014176 [Aristolochia fimbriata]
MKEMRKRIARLTSLFSRVNTLQPSAKECRNAFTESANASLANFNLKISETVPNIPRAVTHQEKSLHHPAKFRHPAASIDNTTGICKSKPRQTAPKRFNFRDSHLVITRTRTKIAHEQRRQTSRSLEQFKDQNTELELLQRSPGVAIKRPYLSGTNVRFRVQTEQNWK